MEIYCNGVASIQDSISGKTFQIEAKDLDWQCVDSSERGMGTENHYEAQVEHEVLGLLTWGVWEYPVGVENYQTTEAGNHRVIEDFDYGLAHSEEDSF